MSSSRITGAAARSARFAQRHPRVRIQRRGYAESASPAGANAQGGSSALVGGLVGGGAVLGVAYGYYHFSGIKTAVQTSKAAQQYFEQAKNKVKEQTPEPNEAIEWLHKTAIFYAGFIPGSRGYVDSAFKDVESVREKHKDKVDSIVREAYDELKQATQEGDMSLDTAGKVWNILQDKLRKIGDLAGDAIEDILDNHPEVKDKVGGNLDQLRQLQDQYGPKVKEEVDRTWEQISSIVSKGVSASTASEIQKVVQEKVKKIRELGDKAYQEGLQQVKPYLDKSPKVKQLVEENEEALKQGNVSELWDKIRQAVDSGDLGDFEEYVNKAVDGAKNKGKKFGVDVDKYLKGIPGSSEILSQVQKIQEIGRKHGKEAEKLFNSTISELKEVLEKKSKEAEKLAKNAKKEKDQ